MSPFMIDEVKETIFSMGPNKALGPDGFTPLFFLEMLGICG